MMVEDIYTDEGVSDSLEDDEISASEEGFMQGYMNEDQGMES
jgi:hypothetical protein